MEPRIEFLMQAAALPDTVFMRVVGGGTPGVDLFVAVAIGLGVLLMYVVAGAAVFAAFRARQAYTAAKASLDEVGGHLRELVSHANELTRNVADLSDRTRKEVAAVQETVEYANQRARSAVTALADRVDAFNDTLALVQRDTQDVVVGALAAIRGVRAGVAAFRGGKRRRRARAMEWEDEFDAAELAYDAPRREQPRGPRLRRRVTDDA